MSAVMTTPRINEISIAVDVRGLSGQILFNSFGVQAKGVWASHTGYRSISYADHTKLPDDDLITMANELAVSLYRAQAPWAFAVGDDHEGWTKINKSSDERLQLRLPSWHSGALLGALESLGFELTCRHNLFVLSPVGMPFDLATKIVKPLMRGGTRFMSEKLLTEQVLNSGLSHGVVPGDSGQYQMLQGALF